MGSFSFLTKSNKTQTFKIYKKTVKSVKIKRRWPFKNSSLKKPRSRSMQSIFTKVLKQHTNSLQLNFIFIDRMREGVLYPQIFFAILGRNSFSEKSPNCRTKFIKISLDFFLFRINVLPIRNGCFSKK